MDLSLTVGSAVAAAGISSPAATDFQQQRDQSVRCVECDQCDQCDQCGQCDQCDQCDQCEVVVREDEPKVTVPVTETCPGRHLVPANPDQQTRAFLVVPNAQDGSDGDPGHGHGLTTTTSSYQGQHFTGLLPLNNIGTGMGIWQ